MKMIDVQKYKSNANRGEDGKGKKRRSASESKISKNKEHDGGMTFGKSFCCL